MKGKAVSGLMLTLLFLGILHSVLSIQSAKASPGTIYIMADGSIDPPTAPINRDGNVYTFSDDIHDQILVGRDNIVIDGAGYTLQGTGMGTGIDQIGLNNVTIKNTEIRAFGYGIQVAYSANFTISGNNITDNDVGILLDLSANTNVAENNIKDNDLGMWLVYSPNNFLYHNNFINNTIQVASDNPSINIWDHGYPSGGNYWSNYTGVDAKNGPYQNETGSDGIGDTTHVIDVNNADFYPLMSPYPSIHAISIEGVQLKTVLAQGFTTKLYVHVANGHFTENVNVTVYANTTLIGTQTNVILASGDSTTLTFAWDTTSFAFGNYTISANVTILQDETDTADNTYTDGVVLVSIPGDVDGDRDVDVGDQRKVQLIMFSVSGDPNWNPNMDIDCDEDVDVGDQRKQQLHMFESW